MSENFDELGELGDKIKKIIDTAVSTKDYRQMTEDIKQTVGQTVNNAVNSAVDSGSEAIRNGLNSVFGSQNQGTYQNKTKEFEERRRREREQEEQKRLENEKAKERMLTLYEKNKLIINVFINCLFISFLQLYQSLYPDKLIIRLPFYYCS